MENLTCIGPVIGKNLQFLFSSCFIYLCIKLYSVNGWLLIFLPVKIFKTVYISSAPHSLINKYIFYDKTNASHIVLFISNIVTVSNKLLWYQAIIYFPRYLCKKKKQVSISNRILCLIWLNFPLILNDWNLINEI